jgi:hypothetical protein
MFVLTLTLDDPEDSGYFTNKTLNKLHGYMRHEKVKLALYFTIQSIKIYASNKDELEKLLGNNAVCIDIRRHIFTAEIMPVTDQLIKVFKRIHNLIYDTTKKVNERIEYYSQDKDFLDPTDKVLVKQEKEKLKTYYQNIKQEQNKIYRKYFIIRKSQDQRFTIWLEVREINVSDFSKIAFNSYGLLHEK